MKEVSTDQLQFGDFRLDVARKILRRGSEVIDVPLKEIEILSMLVRNQGELVTKSELLDEIWEDSFVGESNLSRHIYLLRKTLKGLGADDGLIENVPRRGYRFAGEVRVIEPDEIFVEKRTRTRTLIEVADRPRERRIGSFRVAAFATLFIVLTGASAFFGYQYFRTDDRDAIESLAILPFKVAGDSAVAPHAGTGIADILTTRLSSIRTIKIRPSSASSGLADVDAASAGEQLQVDAVVDGTIYYFNERVRVTARLVRVKDNSVVWAGEFEKLRREELQLQNDLALQIVPALAVNLSGGERDALAKHYTLNADAYELYLKGRYEWKKRSSAGMTEAGRMFRNAIAADPGFALAYVGLADTRSTDQTSRGESAALIAKALELDPNLAEAHASRGFYLMFLEWRWDEAEASFNRSIELNPNYAAAHHWYATLLAIKGNTEGAKAEMHRALELNPTSYNFLADLGQLYYFSGDYPTAKEYCLKALAIYPDFAFAHEYLHYIYLKTGEFENAVVELRKADEINGAFVHGGPTASERVIRAGTVFEENGIDDYLEALYPGRASDPPSYYFYAKKHAFLGEHEKALEYLEMSTNTRQFLAAFLKADPLFENLRPDPRYQKILQKMGLV